MPSSASLAKKKMKPRTRHRAEPQSSLMAELLNCPEISDGNRNFSLSGASFFPKQVYASYGTPAGKPPAGLLPLPVFPFGLRASFGRKRENVAWEEKRDRHLEGKERASFGRKRETVIREKKVEIGRGGGHRIGNKGEFWWDYAGL